MMAVVEAVHGHKKDVAGLLLRTHVSMFKRIRYRTHRVCLLWTTVPSRGSTRTPSEPVVHVVMADETAHACPNCEVFSISDETNPP